MPRANKTVVIIGSGFGGTMAGLSLANEFKNRNKGETILMLERGTWWTTPNSTVQDKEVATYDFLVRKSQPVQYWSAQSSFRGFLDIFTRCFRRPKNEDGLYEFTRLGKPGFLGFFGGENDGVSILRANGVGGGSLVYSNVTIRPPDLVFDDPRWPLSWTAEKRNSYFEFARHAIGFGILSALHAWPDHSKPFVGNEPPIHPINTGLSNIVMRTARLQPHWDVTPDPNSSRGIKRIHLDPSGPPEDQLAKTPSNRLWIDRARVFQTAMSRLTSDFGTVDLSINDLTPEGTPPGPTEPPPNYPAPKPKNYCERQGRCNVGCLPGARHTLNKQLMTAILGRYNAEEKKDEKAEFEGIMELQTLAEVDAIEALLDGRYEIHYTRRQPDKLSQVSRETVTADLVIVAAGVMGTNEIMLRSKQRDALPNLSDKLGFGFSTNGDYLAFLEKTKDWVSLTRGPVTTSFGHFNTTDPGTGPDTSGKTFHTLEDQGVPPALASVTGQGVPLIRSLAKGRRGMIFAIIAILRRLLKLGLDSIREVFTNYRERGKILFRAEEEMLGRMMCIAGMGREAAVGQFRLGGPGETSLRVKRTDGLEFYQDPIYEEIRKSLASLAEIIRDPGDRESKFINPFVSEAAKATSATSIALSHPLGGCRMAESAAEGVVDEFGRVFDKNKTGDRPYYEGLYIVDGSFIPTALGVNPSLTISALSLRAADQIIEEHRTRHP